MSSLLCWNACRLPTWQSPPCALQTQNLSAGPAPAENKAAPTATVTYPTLRSKNSTMFMNSHSTKEPNKVMSQFFFSFLCTCTFMNNRYSFDYFILNTRSPEVELLANLITEYHKAVLQSYCSYSSPKEIARFRFLTWQPGPTPSLQTCIQNQTRAFVPVLTCFHTLSLPTSLSQ